MKWFRNQHPKSTEAVVVQTRTNDATGKPGTVRVPNVATFNTRDGHLEGMDAAGKVIMVVPLSEVSAAVIEQVKP